MPCRRWRYYRTESGAAPALVCPSSRSLSDPASPSKRWRPSRTTTSTRRSSGWPATPRRSACSSSFSKSLPDERAWRAQSGRRPGLEQLEVFALLPGTHGLGHLGADRLLEAVHLALLYGHQVVDEGVPEAGPVEGILPENRQGIPQCGGQHRSVGLGVRLVADGRRIELLGDPVVPRSEEHTSELQSPM